MTFPLNIIHITGLFSTVFSVKILLLLRLRLVKPKLIIIAPRGELGKEALKSKQTKKIAFLTVTKFLGFYDQIVWHASSFKEVQDIHRMLGSAAQVQQAGDFLSSVPEELTQTIAKSTNVKKRGVLRIIFLSRITRIKMIGNLEGDIIFDIYGPVHDRDSWEYCLQQIATLPKNIKVSYLGPVDPSHVGTIFSGYELFLFPTEFESFGHVVLESLSTGCPVLISDRTPWLDLEVEKAGWVVEYGDTQRFQELLHAMVAMGSSEHALLTDNAVRYAIKMIDKTSLIDAHRKLLSYRNTC